jgi:hypothetical protein
MDVLRFTTYGGVGFLICGVCIGVSITASGLREVPLWIRICAACWAITVLAGAIVALVVANPVAGGG